ncbi:MAG: HAMP domain-containing histidine kinase [Lachnospiraceae bacterium]|nr:HAMP domain-containing histidine kinase [Lachnospiraceae bacterium]
MSSNPNNEQKRIRSIRGKIQSMISLRRLDRAISGSFGLSLLIPLIWAIYNEISLCGGIVLSNRHFFSIKNGISSLTYTIAEPSGTVVFTENAFLIMVMAVGVAGINLVLSVLGTLFSIPSEHAKINKILTPIDALAARADEIANFEFNEDKYQLLENAISKIEPEDNKEILLHDAELQGIETAMNNLIGRMKENYRQQARFVNDASHELRTPIAVIEGYANMLARWGREDEKVLDESINAIQNEASNMKHLVEQLLFLARGDSGRTELKLENVELNSLMEEIYEESLMIDENHPYKVRTYGAPLNVSADPALIKQAVRILVDNAAKYTENGDEIVLATGVNEKGRPYLMVQDSGIGMKEADVQHMFDRFYRADEARTREGTGLGLSIAKWIVEKHKGSFTVISRTDLGTRICINL